MAAKPSHRLRSIRRTLAMTLFSLLLRNIHTSASTPSTPAATSSQNTHEVNIEPPPSPRWSKNLTNLSWAMKKVNSVSNATVTVSLKRSPTIEPSTWVNEVFSRWAM